MADDSDDLLGDILEASGKPMAAAEQARADDAPAIEHGEDLLGLSDHDLRAVLAELDLDSLLNLLASGSEDLRRRVLSSLTEDSVNHVRKNLEYMDEVTDRARRDAEAVLREVVGRLLRRGAIASRQVDAKVAERAQHGSLLEQFEQLLALHADGDSQGLVTAARDAHARGLMAGLELLAKAEDIDALESDLDALFEGLVQRERSRLRILREGILALRRGDSPELFRKRMGD